MHPIPSFKLWFKVRVGFRVRVWVKRRS